jgi:hypothetical protein
VLDFFSSLVSSFNLELDMPRLCRVVPCAATILVSTLALSRPVLAASIFVSPPGSSTISEPAGSTTFTITLSQMPTSPVSIDLNSSDTAQCVPSPAQAVLDGTNWDTGVIVTIQAVDDAVSDGTQSCTILTAPASSGDDNYFKVDPADVTVSVLDDEPVLPDGDGDGVPDASDNCPAVANPDQADLDEDGIGNACDLDDDGDGVSDAIENAGPNDGDANADSSADSLQFGVASLPAAAGGSYLTLEIPSGSCRFLRSVATTAESAQPVADATWDYPQGLISFRVPSCSAVTLRLLLHGRDTIPADWAYRKYGPTTPGSPGSAAWYSLPGATFGSSPIGAATVATATFTLTDGSLGDDTAVDGEIVDQGGPAQPVQGPPPLPFEVPTVSTLGLIVLGAALLAAALLRLHKRRPA